jgi:hypothetical protein
MDINKVQLLEFLRAWGVTGQVDLLEPQLPE